MNKILLIIEREYLTRVKKKSFLLVTFLVPLLIIGVYALMIVLTMNSFENNLSNVHVVDQSGVFKDKFTDTKQTKFIVASSDIEAEKQQILKDGEKNYLLVIPENIEQSLSAELYASEKAGLNLQTEVSKQLESILRNKQLEASGIDVNVINAIKPNITVAAKELTSEGERDGSVFAAMGTAVGLSIFTYLALVLYGSQVMRGVIEEKSSRIVEVIISSVKPFQLMMGKILGIGLVGITQFLLWILLSGTLFTVATMALADKDTVEQTLSATQQSGIGGEMPEEASTGQSNLINSIKSSAESLDITKILVFFLVYFIGGYMLYSALFATVGSAVENESESQQFVFPITMPLLFTYILSFGVLINDPNGTLAVWLSMIPFTSPIAMLVRLPFGVPDWQLALSIAFLIGGFILTTWVASRIYRVGILMYGKKVSYKELAKWFNYKA